MMTLINTGLEDLYNSLASLILGLALMIHVNVLFTSLLKPICLLTAVIFSPKGLAYIFLFLG